MLVVVVHCPLKRTLYNYFQSQRTIYSLERGFLLRYNFLVDFVLVYQIKILLVYILKKPFLSF